MIAIANQKGGCAKTTTTINLGACLARLNQRVLLVDLDPQAHTTLGLGMLPEKLNRTLADLLCPEEERKSSWEETVVRLNPCLFLLPGDLRLHHFEEVFSDRPQREKQLKYLLLFSNPRSDPYDFILIDCPPNLGLLTLNALEAAREVLVPIEPSFFSLHGLAKISETLQRVGEKRQRPHQVNALLTLFEKRHHFSEEIYEEVRKHFKDRMFHSVIHETVSLREAAAAGLSIVDYDSESLGYRDHMNLAREILELGWRWEYPANTSSEPGQGRRAAGPRKVCGGLLFQMEAPEAKEVLVAGDFNQWVGEPLFHQPGNGLWQRVLPLQGGSFRYKFLVDGEWKVDPASAATKENPFGTADSWIDLDEKKSPTLKGGSLSP